MDPPSAWGLYSERIDKPREKGQLEGYESLSQLIDGEKIALYIKKEQSVCIIGSQFNYWKGRSNRYSYIEKFDVGEGSFDIKKLLEIFFKHLQEALQPDEAIIGLGNSQNNWDELKEYLDNGLRSQRGTYFPFIYGKLLLNAPIHILCPGASHHGSSGSGRISSPSVDIIRSINLVIEVFENIRTPVREYLLLAVCDDFKKTLSNFDIIIHPEKKSITDYNQKKFFGDPLPIDLNLSDEKLLVHPDTRRAAEKIVDLYEQKVLPDTRNYRQYVAEFLKRLYIKTYPEDLLNKNIMKSDIGFELGSEYIRVKILGADPVRESDLRMIYASLSIRDSGDLLALLAGKSFLAPEVVRDATPIVILKNNYELFKKIARMSVEREEDKKQIVSYLDGVLEKIDWSETNNKAFNNGISLVKKAVQDPGILSHPLGKVYIRILLKKLEETHDITTEFSKQELQIFETKKLSKQTKAKNTIFWIIILLVVIAGIIGGIVFYYYFVLPHPETEINPSPNETGTSIVQQGDIQLPAINTSPVPTFYSIGETDVCLSAFIDGSQGNPNITL
jgi:hypothetical protein